MADDLSLLFRLRGDATSLKQATAESRQGVDQLKQALGPEFNQTASLAGKVFGEAIGGIEETLQSLVDSQIEQVPVVGSVFNSVTEGAKSSAEKADLAINLLSNSISSLSTVTGKSAAQVTSFLKTFRELKTPAERNEAAFKAFGGTVDAIGNKTARLLPELEQASLQMGNMAASGGIAARALTALGGSALPVAIAAAGVIALVGTVVLLTKELFDASKAAADFQGKMQDLSQQTGVAVETLSALEIAAATTGGNLTTITQALVQFQRRLDESLDPLSKTAAEFRDLGIETDNTETALRQAFTALARMPEGFRQTNAAAELFGARGGKQVLAIIKETGGDVDDLTRRARDLGILIESDAARAADRLNDELALLRFTLRDLQAEIGNELIPALTDLVRGFADVVRAGRPFLQVLGSLAKTPFQAIAGNFRTLGIVIRATTGDIEGATKALRELREEEARRKEIPVQTTEGPQPTSLPGEPSPRQQAAEAARLADDLVAITKRRVESEAQVLSQLFEQGRRDREQQARETVELNRQVLKSETDRIDAQLQVQEQAFRNIARERLSRQEVIDAEQSIQAQVSKLQQDRLDKEAEFERTSSAIRAKAAKERADSLRNEAANTTDLLITEFGNQVKRLEAELERGGIAEDTALIQIEQLERAKIDARIEGLEEQKRIGFLTVEEQKDLDRQLQAARQEADHLDEEQQRRRLARSRLTAERIRDIKLAEIETLLQLEQLQAERIIASIEALADARVLSEEQAARRILAVRLGLIDSEIEATRARLEAASTIVDTNERIRAEADLNNRLRVLASERVSIETEGNRAIDDARATDLDNEQRYNDELERLRERTRNIEFDAAEEVIRLMRVTFARRRDIIRAERDLDLAREADRNRRALESINRQQRAVDAEIKILEARLESLTIGTTEEIEQYERIIVALERLRLKRLELQGQADAEGALSAAITRGINAGTQRELDPFGDLKLNLDDLKQFTNELEASVVPLGDILRRTFLQVADAIGSVVSNYVLLGETGPAVMRKILAQALASIAAEAAVNAIKMAAVGFARLAFFDFAGAANAFASAGLWAAIAGGTAIAGRAVAGDLFKPQQSASGAGRSGSGSSARDREPSPIDLSRQQQTINVNIIVHGEPGPGFNQEVVRAVVHDVSINGPSRDAIVKTAGG